MKQKLCERDREKKEASATKTIRGGGNEHSEPEIENRDKDRGKWDKIADRKWKYIYLNLAYKNIPMICMLDGKIHVIFVG